MQSSYEVLDQIFNNAPSSMFVMDREHRFILTNPALLQFWGLTKEQLIGHTELTAFPQESASSLWADNEYIMSTNRPLQHEEELLLKNGQHKSRASVKFPFHDHNGKVIGLCGIATDITPLKQAEDALRASESTYRALFDNMLNGLAYCRMVYIEDQPVDFVYIKVNKTFETLTGLHHVIGRKASDVIPGICEQDQQLLEVYGRVALTGQSEHFELFVNSLQTWFSLSVFSPQAGYFVAVFEVITDKKIAEQSLKESEQRLRLALEAAQLGIFEWNLNTNRLIWSQRTVEIFGYRPDEFSGDYTDFSNRVHPEDLPKVEIEIARSKLERNRYYCEFRIIWPDATVHWIMGTGEFTYNSEGQPLQMLGTAEEISQRKLTEESLITSEKEFRLLAEAMPQIVWITRANGMNIFFNQQWVDYTGLTLEESYGHGWNKPFHPDDQKTAWEAWQKAINNNDNYSLECRLRRTDGVYRWWLIRGIPIVDENGEIYKWFGTCTDIHNLKANEEEIRSSKIHLESAMNSMSDAICISDTEGKFTHFNDAFATFHKFRNKRECANVFTEYTKLLDVYLPSGELVPIEQWVVPRALRGEADKDVEFTLRKKDTGETWVGCYNYAPIHSDSGMITGSVVTARDITEKKRTEQKLREAEELWISAHYTRNLIETSLDPLLTISSDGKITDVNAATEAVTGYSRDKLIGSNFSDYFTAPMEAMTVYQQVFLAGSIRNYALKIHHKDGHLTSILFNATVYRNEAGQIAGIFAAARDITDIELIQQALKSSEDLFKAMFTEAPLGIALIDSLTGQINAVNPMFAKIAGRTMVEMMNIDWMSITHPDDLQKDLDNMALLNAGKISGFTMEKRYLRLDGSFVWINMTIAPIVVADKAHPQHLCMIEDISARKITEKTIKQLAFHDPLTQLPNRRLLYERLKHSIDVGRRDGKNLALLMLDLDRFKRVNDSFGHLAGDELLQKVAERIAARLRDVDMVARLGGDEFVVLLENITQPEDAAQVANEIIADLTARFCLSQSDDILIGASIGISLYPQHGTSPEMLMDHADAALYQAKDAGRGCFAYFSEELTLAAQERIALEQRLRLALAEQQLRVFYQPQIDISSGQIMGVEALVRWQDPLNGLRAPQQFIAIAEDSGLIVEISTWVLYEACRQGKQWLDEGFPPLTIAVNVSAHQLRRNNMAPLVSKVLAETGFPANYLELEITETGLMEYQDKAADILKDLRAQGVRVAIDDFGTGYSSLSSLKHFPIDVLKIDKSFIDDIPFHQDDMEITATIIGMAHTLGLKVLAVGVETTAQLEFLTEKGCDSYQGYLRSQPVSAEEMARLLMS